MAKRTTAQRGYGSHHRKIRDHYQAIIDSGEAVYCWRPDCGKQLFGRDWHLGHDDDDRTKYRGPECIKCNTSAGGKSAHNLEPTHEQQSRTW